MWIYARFWVTEINLIMWAIWFFGNFGNSVDDRSCSPSESCIFRLAILQFACFFNCAPENCGLFLWSWSQHWLMMLIIWSHSWGLCSGMISTQGLFPCDTCKSTVVTLHPASTKQMSDTRFSVDQHIQRVNAAGKLKTRHVCLVMLKE